MTIGARPRTALVFASATHVWSDLLFALLVPLLVLMKEDPDLALSFSEVGLLRAAHAGASAVLQVPFGFMAERVGEFWLLIGGNIWVCVGFLAMAAASGFPLLFTAALVGGLGGGTQHPLASSLVSRLYDTGGRSTAVGTVNFAGDLGKMAAAALSLLLAIPFGWRPTLRGVAVAGIALMALSTVVRRGVSSGKRIGLESVAASNSRVKPRVGAFLNLSVVGVLDDAVRASALTFVPFLMRDKGMSIEQVFGMLFLLLAGGAIGKFACGWLDDRYGSVRLIWGTKGLTAALLLASIAAPPVAMAPLVVVLGIGLNGTSSVLYGTVAKFVPPPLRPRYYGYFYTAIQAGSTFAPLLYGILADLRGIRATIAVIAFAAGLILPVSLSLRRHLVEDAVLPAPSPR